MTAPPTLLRAMAADLLDEAARREQHATICVFEPTPDSPLKPRGPDVRDAELAIARRRRTEAAALTAGAEALEMLALGDGAEAFETFIRGDHGVPLSWGVQVGRDSPPDVSGCASRDDARHALAARLIATARAEMKANALL